MQMQFLDAEGDIIAPVDLVDEKAATVEILGIDNRYFNGYRRGYYLRNGIESLITPGSTVTLVRTTSVPGDPDIVETVNYVLPDLSVNGKLFVHAKKGKDKEGYWCCQLIDDIRLDTLVLDPDAERAYLVWRGTWEFDQFPLDHYRMLKVAAEEVH